jgi:hypothetical protein
MKTIAFRDLAGGGFRIWNPKINYNQFELTDKPKRIDRRIDGLNDLKHTGNIAVYLVYGNKMRLLFKKYL